eukprot:55500-Eustigmatos_ZCMA.PRE.1
MRGVQYAALAAAADLERAHGQVRGLERLDPQTVVMTMNTSDPGGGVIDLIMRTSAQSPEVVTLDISAHGGELGPLSRGFPTAPSPVQDA